MQLTARCPGCTAVIIFLDSDKTIVCENCESCFAQDELDGSTEEDGLEYFEGEIDGDDGLDDGGDCDDDDESSDEFGG